MNRWSAASDSRTAVQALPVEPEVPHLAREFIDKCLDDMRRLGLIPAPAMTIAAE